MPIVPGNIAQPISLDVPGPDIRGAGAATGGAIEKLGESLQNSAFYILDKLRTTEANDAVYSAKAADSIESEKYRANLLASSPDGYVRGADGGMVENSDPISMGKYQTVTQKYRDWANDRFLKNTDGMPNNIAEEAYHREGGAFFSTEINRVFNEEQSTRFNFTKQKDLTEANGLSDHFIDYPGMYGSMNDQFYSKTDQFTQNIAAKVKSGVYNSAQGLEFTREHLAHMSNSNAGGALQFLADSARSGEPDALLDLKAGVKGMINVIEGFDDESRTRRRQGLPVYSDMLTPHDKEHRINQFLSLVTHKTKEDRLGPWETFIKNQADGAKINVGGDGAFEKGFDQAVAWGMRDFVKADGTGQQVPTEVFTKSAVILSANAEWEAKQSHFAMLPEAQQADARTYEQRYFAKKIDNLLAKYGQIAPEVKNGVLADVMKSYDQAIASDQAEYKKDSAAYVVAHTSNSVGKPSALQLQEDAIKQKGIVALDPHSLSSYLQKVDRQVKAKEPGDPSLWRAASENFSNYFGDQLMNTDIGNPELKARAITQARNVNPQVFDRFVDQMIKDNAGYNSKVDYRLQYLKQMPTVPLATRFFADLQTSQATIESNFNASFAAGNNTVDFEQFKKKVLAQPDFSQWINGQQQAHEGDPDISKRMSALTDFYVKDAARVYLSSGGSKIPEDAAKDAYTALIGNTRLVSQSSRGGFFSSDERATIFRIYPQKTPDGLAINQDVMKVLESKVHEVEHVPEFYRSTAKIEPPADYIARAQRMGLDKQTTYDNFYKVIAATAKWHVDPDSDNGFIVKYTDGFNKQGKVAQVKDPVSGKLTNFVYPFKNWYSGILPPTKINRENVQKQKNNSPIDMGILSK